MGLQKVEFLPDRLRVFYHLNKPYGSPDENKKLDLPYDAVSRFPELPISDQLGIGLPREMVEIDVPRCRKTIIFVFESFPESDGGPLEENLKGVYLKNN